MTMKLNKVLLVTLAPLALAIGCANIDTDDFGVVRSADTSDSEMYPPGGSWENITQGTPRSLVYGVTSGYGAWENKQVCTWGNSFGDTSVFRAQSGCADNATEAAAIVSIASGFEGADSVVSDGTYVTYYCDPANNSC